MTTIAFLVLPTLNIPPLSPLPLPLPLHLPYLLLSPHSRSLCDIVHDGLPDQPAVLSPVCWLSGGRSCQNLHPLLRGEMEPCICTCLDLSSPPLPPHPPLHRWTTINSWSQAHSESSIFQTGIHGTRTHKNGRLE